MDKVIKEERHSTVPMGNILEHLKSDGLATEKLLQCADQVRRATFGDAVHIRGIIEFSNYCCNHCLYCGINCTNGAVLRYRMTADEIIDAAHAVKAAGCGTVVLQSGVDGHNTEQFLTELICRVKGETGLAITMSVGVLPERMYEAIRKAGCDRYLLRFETARVQCFNTIHPDESFDARMHALAMLKAFEFQVGSGFMIGLPGDTLEDIAKNIEFATSLHLDMIGCGPFIANPATPMANVPLLDDLSIYYKVIALLRMLNPKAHIPATTAFDVIESHGRDRVLNCGANVFMPNMTPVKYRESYQLYPGKPSVDETPEASAEAMRMRIAALGRTIAEGPGHALTCCEANEVRL